MLDAWEALADAWLKVDAASETLTSNSKRDMTASLETLRLKVKALAQPQLMNNSMHIFLFHVGPAILKHGALWRFSQQGTEARVFTLRDHQRRRTAKHKIATKVNIGALESQVRILKSEHDDALEKRAAGLVPGHQRTASQVYRYGSKNGPKRSRQAQ